MTLLLILLIVVLLLVVLGGGGYTYRRYYGPGPAYGGGEVVESDHGSPLAALVLLILAVLVILFLIYGGFNFWHWFGGTTENVNVTVRS